jgi:VWFA-related protein
MKQCRITRAVARWVSACLVVLWLAGLGEIHECKAQQEPAVLRITTRMVEVQVLVHDKQGKPVSGLSKKDFVLTDRGQPQKITLFAVESNRTSPPPPSPLPPDVFSNLLPRGAVPATTATVVLFDKLNTRTEDQNYARWELVKFLKQAGPGERIAVAALGNDLHILAGFNAEPQARLDAAAADQGHTSQLLDMSEVRRADPGSVDDALSILDNRAAEVTTIMRVDRTLEALDAIARYLSHLPGRKNLVWISGSFPFSIGYQADAVEDRDNAWRFTRLSFSSRVARTARLLTDGNVAVYPVDARGLTGVPMAESSAGFGYTEDGAAIPSSEIQAQESMKTLAELTGGRAFTGTNDLSGAIGQALEDSTIVYVLGYQPSHDEWDGKFRPIEVQVKRHGLKVQHRHGYFAFAEEPEKSREASLIEACWSPLDATGIGLVASVTPAEAPRTNQWKVLLLLDAQHITMESKERNWCGTLDLLFVERDAEGKDLSVIKTTLPMRLTQASFEELLRQGARLTKYLDVIPSAVRLRIAVRDRPSGMLGSITIPLKQAQK